MAYILYARKSQESEERQIQSIDDQVRRDRELAAIRAVTVCEEITESKSAKEPDERPGFSLMISLIESGKADGIIAWHPDRLSRNELDAAKITYLVRKGKIRDLLFVNYHFVNSPEGIMMLQMALSQSQYYSAKLATDVTRGMRSKVEKGWSPHYAPQGYVNDRNTRTVVPDPERFDVIRRAWDLMLTGAYTVAQVLHILNDEWGYRTKSGPRRAGGPVSLPTLYKMFHSLYYVGMFKEGGATFDGRHKPMVTPGEFDRVQRIIARQGKQQPKRHTYAYTGLMRCARCGCGVTAETQPGCHGRGRYVYYHCTDYKRVCTKVSIREDELEAKIERLLRRLTIEPEVEAFALGQVERWQVRQIDACNDATGQQASTIEDMAEQQKTLLDLRLRQIIGDEEFARKRSELDGQLTELRSRSGAATAELEKVKSSARNAVRFMAQAHRRFLVGTTAEKREIAQALGVKYVFNRGQVHITPHPTLASKHLILKAYRYETGTVEPPNSGLGSTKTPAFAGALSSGGAGDHALEDLFYGNESFPPVSCIRPSALSPL